MKNEMDRARVAAIWMVQGAVLAKLLRAHGKDAHAGHLESALNEVLQIISREVDRDALTNAMSWITDRMWGCDGPSPASHLPN